MRLAIGEQTAENVKIEIGSAMPTKEKMEYQIRGRDLVTGLPKDIMITFERDRGGAEPAAYRHRRLSAKRFQ